MPKSNKILKPVYMDYASSALSNPSSIHDLGVKIKKSLENARTEIAKSLYAHSDEIIFTSGGTESNNLAILGIIQKFHKTLFFSGPRFSSSSFAGEARPFA